LSKGRVLTDLDPKQEPKPMRKLVFASVMAVTAALALTPTTKAG
jgi:hypothetical protein